MAQDEKILQITGSGEMIYALSSEGKVYVGTLEKKGFEWRRLPPMNFETMKQIHSVGGADEEGSQPVLSAPNEGEYERPTLLRDEVKKEEAKAAEAPKK